MAAVPRVRRLEAVGLFRCSGSFDYYHACSKDADNQQLFIVCVSSTKLLDFLLLWL